MPAESRGKRSKRKQKDYYKFYILEKNIAN